MARSLLALASGLTKFPLNVAPPGNSSLHVPGGGMNGMNGTGQTHAPIAYTPSGPVSLPQQYNVSGGIAGAYNSTIRRAGVIPQPLTISATQVVTRR